MSRSSGDGWAVEVTGLQVVRGGRPVLRDVSVRVRAGAVTGLLGPSGCGKTTLMRAIVGVQVVQEGRVRVLGSPAGAAELRPRVGYMTQDPAVYGDLSVEENLRYFARIVDVDDRRVDAVLDAVELRPLRRQVVGSLSGGERSRVSLATALLNRPQLLVLDEPTVGLDPVLRVELWAMFHRLADAGTTLLVSSHVMDEARECDELLLMREGAILDHTTPGALRETTGADDLGQAFLAMIERTAA